MDLRQPVIVSGEPYPIPLRPGCGAGSLISAIDPVATLAVFADIKVPSLLYNLVFGMPRRMSAPVLALSLPALSSCTHASVLPLPLPSASLTVGCERRRERP